MTSATIESTWQIGPELPCLAPSLYYRDCADCYVVQRQRAAQDELARAPERSSSSKMMQLTELSAGTASQVAICHSLLETRPELLQLEALLRNVFEILPFVETSQVVSGDQVLPWPASPSAAQPITACILAHARQLCLAEPACFVWLCIVLGSQSA